MANYMNETSTNQDNITEGCYDYFLEETVFLSITLFLLGLITVIGNSFTILSYLLSDNIRRLTLNTYIFNLAIADLGMGIITFWGFFLYLVFKIPYVTMWSSLIWNFMFHLCLYLSVSSLIFISLDRYVMVSDPINYRFKERKKKAWKKLAITWIFCFMLSLASQLLLYWLFYDVYYLCLSEFPIIIHRAKNVSLSLTLVADFLIPFSIIVVLNVMVLFKIWKRTHTQLKRWMLDLGITETMLRREYWMEWKQKQKLRCSYFRNWFTWNGGDHNVGNVTYQIDFLSILLAGFHRPNIYNHSETPATVPRNSSPQSNLPSQPAGLNGDRVENNTHQTIGDDVITPQNKQALLLLKKRMSLERKRLLKATSGVLVFVQVFHLCWMPFYIVTLVSYFVPPSTAIYRAQSIAMLLLCCNSLINPFLYAMMSKSYREFLSRYILRRK